MDRDWRFLAQPVNSVNQALLTAWWTWWFIRSESQNLGVIFSKCLISVYFLSIIQRRGSTSKLIFRDFSPAQVIIESRKDLSLSNFRVVCVRLSKSTQTMTKICI